MYVISDTKPYFHNHAEPSEPRIDKIIEYTSLASLIALAAMIQEKKVY